MSLNCSVSEGSSYEHNELPLDPPLCYVSSCFTCDIFVCSQLLWYFTVSIIIVHLTWRALCTGANIYWSVSPIYIAMYMHV